MINKPFGTGKCSKSCSLKINNIIADQPVLIDNAFNQFSTGIPANIHAILPPHTRDFNDNVPMNPNTAFLSLLRLLKF